MGERKDCINTYYSVFSKRAGEVSSHKSFGDAQRSLKEFNCLHKGRYRIYIKRLIRRVYPDGSHGLIVYCSSQLKKRMQGYGGIGEFPMGDI